METTNLELVEEPRGSAALQISNAIGRIHKDYIGRGPDRVRTHIEENVVVCLLEGGFTRAEHAVREHSGGTVVIEMRLRLQGAMRQSISEAVEEVMGRRVRSFMSANDPDHDVQAEIMLLDQEPSPQPS
jgi:uncharacterized protein YbcI